MTITILYFDGCPNWELARERVTEAARLAGARDDIELRRVESPEEADQIGFAGSPTILIDGADPFPNGATASRAAYTAANTLHPLPNSSEC